MKRKLAALGLAVALVSGASLVPLSMAQQPQTQAGYTVVPGDNAWTLAGRHLGDPRVWQRIVDDNPFLQQPGRVFTRNGVTYVMMHPGERLMGLDQYGIVTAPVVYAQAQSNELSSDPFHMPDWVWWVLGGLAACGAVAYLVHRVLHADPATSGPAMVPGGVTDERGARERFETIGRRQYFQVLDVTPGYIWGVMNVRYANGQTRPRVLNCLRAYQAHVRHDDNSEETLYMLEACGNDLRYGGIARYLPGPGFRFVADTAAKPASVAEAEPAPATEPKPLADAPAPGEGEPTMPDGVVRIEYRRPVAGDDPDQRTLVRATGQQLDELFVDAGPRGVTIRFRESDKS